MTVELAKPEVCIMSEAISVLAEERKKQGKTIQDIEEAIHIRREFIEAIEAGKLERLPPCYGAYFVKDYADYLQIDAGPVLSDLRIKEEGNSDLRVAESADLPMVVLSSFQNRQKRGLRYALGIALTLLTLFVVGILNWNWADRPLRETRKWVSTRGSAQDTKSRRIEKLSEKVESESLQSAEPVGDSSVVSIRLWVGGEPSWARIRADEQTVYEGILVPGSYQEWKGSSKLEIRVGNAGAVRIQVNEKELGVLGTSGQVITKTFTPQTAL